MENLAGQDKNQGHLLPVIVMGKTDLLWGGGSVAVT